MRGEFQTDDSWFSFQPRGGAHDYFQNEIYVNQRLVQEWGSELEFEGDIEPMEGQTDSDPDDCQDVTHRKWEKRHVLSHP